MTTNELLEAWANILYTQANLKASSLSTKGSKLFSYELQIAERFNNGRLALILPHGTSTVTTNRHISNASSCAHQSMHILHTYHVPVLDPASQENIAHFEHELHLTFDTVLNKRRIYKNRVLACEAYYGALHELQDYCEAVNKPVPDLPADSLLDQIEEAGDLKFLGQLALEGDARHLHNLNDGYRSQHEH